MRRLWLVLTGVALIAGIHSACDQAPGPEVTGARGPILEDFSFAPQRLVYALLPEEQIRGDSLDVPISISVTARGGHAPVDQVQFIFQSGDDIIQRGMLRAERNNRYSAVATLTIPALEIASYTVLVFAVDREARLGGEVRGTLEYVRVFEPGSPPMLDELIVPDTLQRPAAGQPAASLVIAARASDPDGLSDIERVEFWNVEAPAERILLCDDGGARPCGRSPESGDVARGDGIFTRRVFIQSTNRTGVNTLVFQAIDRAGLESPELSAEVVITE